jgi:uncharacterized protein YbjT (DUF2867 family)
MNRVAIVIGATGMVGFQLVDQLIKDPRFSEVKIFVRRSTGIVHSKLREYLINFNQPLEWNHEVRGDVLFSSLGTTLKQAGSKQAQYKIDHTYQYQFALAAANNHVPFYVLISSYGANEKSLIFYSRVKGELENEIKKLPFRHIHILQPGMLEGDRKEKRLGEGIGLRILKFLNQLGLAKTQRPVHAKIVARAMINASFNEDSFIQTWPLLKVFELAENVYV